MPAKAKELMRAAQALGFVLARQKGSHARWRRRDGRATTIPVHPSTEIGGWLYHKILGELGITEEEFRKLRSESCGYGKVKPMIHARISSTLLAGVNQ